METFNKSKNLFSTLLTGKRIESANETVNK